MDYGTPLEALKEDWQVGEKAWFEYHCWRSHESADAELWYRDHQEVTVVANGRDLYDYVPELDTIVKRGEEGMPRVYTIRFADGFEHDATEDELLVDASFLDPKLGPPPVEERGQQAPRP